MSDWVITARWLRQWASPRGRWTRAQVTALGVRWPAPAGWPQRVIGQVIAEDARVAFERGRG